MATIRNLLCAFLFAGFGLGTCVAQQIVAHKLGPNDETVFKTGSKFAVVIGINAYARSPLDCCVNDASKVAELLKESGGYDKVFKVVDAPNDPLVHPTAKNIWRAIDDVLTKAREGDSVLVFFAGHGGLKMTPNGSVGCLVPIDDDGTEATAVLTSKLREKLEKSRASQKFLILDCCHAGALRGGPVRAPGQAANIGNQIAAEFSMAKGLWTLTACQGEEESLEWRAKGHGLFTYYLLEGLSGGAELFNDGFIDVDELYRFVSRNVPDKAIEISRVPGRPSHQQNPARWYLGPIGVPFIAKLKQPPDVGPAPDNGPNNPPPIDIARIRGDLKKIVQLAKDGDLGVAESTALGLIKDHASRKLDVPWELECLCGAIQFRLALSQRELPRTRLLNAAVDRLDRARLLAPKEQQALPTILCARTASNLAINANPQVKIQWLRFSHDLIARLFAVGVDPRFRPGTRQQAQSYYLLWFVQNEGKTTKGIGLDCLHFAASNLDRSWNILQSKQAKNALQGIPNREMWNGKADLFSEFDELQFAIGNMK